VDAVQFYEEQQAILGYLMVTELEWMSVLISDHPQSFSQVHSSGILCAGQNNFDNQYFLEYPQIKYK
jgi:hypothetical protein